MSVPRQDEPIIAIIAVYTLRVLNQIKRGEDLHPREWEYLKSQSLVLLEEFLMELDLDFTPSEAAERQHQLKSLTEINWQTESVHGALSAMNIVAKDLREDTLQKMTDALLLFKSVVDSVSRERRYPEEKKLREGFENCRQFLYHLYGASVGVYTMDIRRLLDAA